eukprot:scaffold8849_cov101-Isochrysis_galbana.AAC.4
MRRGAVGARSGLPFASAARTCRRQRRSPPPAPRAPASTVADLRRRAHRARDARIPPATRAARRDTTADRANM